MDKNTVIGFLLIAAVLIGFSWYSRPSEEEIAEQQKMEQKVQKARQEAQRKQVLQKQKQIEQIAQAVADTTALFHSALTGKEQNIVLRNNKVELTLSSRGATVNKAVIKGYIGHDILVKDGSKDQPNVTLFAGKDQRLNFTLEAKESNISTENLFFKPSNVTDSTVTFTAEAAPGKYIEMNYKLGRDYLLSLDMRAVGMEGLFAPNQNQVDVDWQDRVRQQERGFNFENRYATLTYKETESGADHMSETKEETDKNIEEALDWVAFKNQFFSAVIISKDGFAANSKMTSIPQQKETRYLKQYEAKMKTAFDPSGRKASQFEFYYGPNDFRMLKKVEKESAFGKELLMERLVYLGWPLFRIINRWFTLYVFDWLSKVFPMGIVLILITLLLKAITYPMVKKSYMSSAKMRVLKPKLDEETKQYDKPEDQLQKQQAMMQLYSEYGVSPLSGCLPMLIQMPIWIAMFNFVPNAIQLRGQSFLWMHDLSTYDPIFEWSKNLWLIGDHLSLTCVLFVGAQLIYSWFTMQLQKDQMVGQQAEQQMKMMKWMMLLMPLMFFFIFNDYSSGLNFYYFISLLFSAIIMWVLRKTTNDEKLLAILEARRAENKKNPKKQQGGLAARLQRMQQEQQEMMRKREELERKRKR